MSLDNKLALAALSSAMDDYESIESVQDQLCKFLGEIISEEMLFSAFCSLEAGGLVEAYRVGSDNRKMALISSKNGKILADDWFLATDKGRRFVEKEWKQNFGINE
jgi:hypothetical protein